MGVERKAVEDQRDADLEARAQKLEADLAELEAEGANADARRKVRGGSEREMGQLLHRAQRELDASEERTSDIVVNGVQKCALPFLSTLEAEMGVERKALEEQRDADLEARDQKRESDLAELEAGGVKADARRKVRDGGEREMRQLRARAQRELDRIEEIWTTFTKLAPKQLIVDEGIYRELIDRYGEYFSVAMGAESLQQLMENFDIDAEADLLRDEIGRATCRDRGWICEGVGTAPM